MNKISSQIPRCKLALLPTPVRPLAALGGNLFMKQDNLSGAVYGGNKIRKLEFLLGEARAEGRKSVVTYGAAGSNHALATAVCCRQLGLRAISILAPQQTSSHVRKNLLMQHAVGAEMILCSDFTDFPQATRRISGHRKQEDGIAPYIIPAGGTNATGALGFVEAAFEMAAQIGSAPQVIARNASKLRLPRGRRAGGDTTVPQAASLPEPDVIYLPMGTGGTLAGLLVGLKLAGLQTRIEAIRVVEPAFRNASHIKALCDDLCVRLEIDPVVKESDIVIRDEFFGEGYGIPTAAGREAVETFQSLENVRLENTYTGKTAAALLHDLRSGKLDGQTVLHWNTLNSRDLSKEIANIDFHDLPPAFHAYFKPIKCSRNGENGI